MEMVRGWEMGRLDPKVCEMALSDLALWETKGLLIDFSTSLLFLVCTWCLHFSEFAKQAISIY